jgi:hypothetical protein
MSVQTQCMRTTVTLDPDVETLVRALMRAQGLSFKEAINCAIRAGLDRGPEAVPFRAPSFSMGVAAGLNSEKALRLAGELEDEELIRNAAVGK